MDRYGAGGRRGKREMAGEHVFDSVHKELLIGELPREALKYLLFWLETFFPPPIRQQEKWLRRRP